MAEEFWKDIKPIPEGKVFKPHALKDHYLPKITEADDRYFFSLSPTVKARPLWISPGTNRWCGLMRVEKPGLVQRHYHPHEVFAYTISGKWSYLEHDWVATAGDFIYEAPGEGHTLVVHESDEPMMAMFIVKGPLCWLDEEGEVTGVYDVHDYIAAAEEQYEKSGIGKEYLHGLFR